MDSHTCDVLLAIRIRWKLGLAVIPLLAISPQQITCHDSTVVVSCTNFIAIAVLKSKWEWNYISIEFEMQLKKNTLVKWALAWQIGFSVRGGSRPGKLNTRELQGTYGCYYQKDQPIRIYPFIYKCQNANLYRYLLGVVCTIHECTNCFPIINRTLMPYGRMCTSPVVLSAYLQGSRDIYSFIMRFLVLTKRCLYTVSLYWKFMGPTWGPSGPCQPQMGPMFGPMNLKRHTG